MLKSKARVSQTHTADEFDHDTYFFSLGAGVSSASTERDILEYVEATLELEDEWDGV